MATAKKKSNYIGYDLEWLEKKCKQLQEWVEEKLDGGIKDRIEVYESTRGNPIIKVISSEETQIKCLRDTLRELPVMLLEINRLKKIVNEEESGEKDIRGDHDIPGFMDDDEDEVVQPKKEEKGSSKKTKKSPTKALPASNTSFNTTSYDDDFEEMTPGDFEEP